MARQAKLLVTYVRGYEITGVPLSGPKCKVFRAVVLLTLLYGAEVWTIYRTEVKKLHAYMMRQLRDITDIKWYDKITNDEILSRAHLLWIDGLLIEKNLG